MPSVPAAPFKAKLRASILACLLFAGADGSALAQCGNGPGGFNAWLQRFRLQAAAQGIRSGTVLSALSSVSYDPTIIRLDRSQRSFKLSFEQFYARRVNGTMIRRGRALMQRHSALLNRIEQRFGVPGAVIVAIWGLETNYGANLGARYSVIRSLATLAYDCRRTEFFTGQLLDALRIVEEGDMTAAQLRGGWAGEIGQTQFLPTPYIRFAVDFDGDGRKDLIQSVPDVLASTASFLAGHGWKRGDGWQPGSANYGVIAEWNKADVYDRTIAAMADQLAGH
ncbi:lytic transglycosylase domain-containing protein [Hyphomicrobium sp.]|jgi:lytic murein transglycosylase|uniref:lytic murein transglycosylase n=1 Tax=Hyphomicrobium sp. TaxID=82 RepID=UPI00356AFC5B